jgi:hypothetical protein
MPKKPDTINPSKPLTTLQKLQLMVHGALGSPVNPSSNDSEQVVKVAGDVGEPSSHGQAAELPSKL